ncbi:class I SAM-dependent methyltransferase [Candidatus Collierbacteria bacterium]|nr:class I SAM-dependent methyltransferase [Candidatus Collierbacteria bacterium]
MRDYSRIDEYLDNLAADIYPQPPDDMHRNQTKDVFYTWIAQRVGGIKTALDVGCGQGVAFPFFAELGIQVTGITLGPDYDVCKSLGLDVKPQDMHFLQWEAGSFDLVFARHVLEHSPAPLLALMEWKRVSKRYCVVVVPHHSHVAQGGINHYYMLNPIQWKVLFKRAGWVLVHEDYSDPSEHRFLLEKQ